MDASMVTVCVALYQLTYLPFGPQLCQDAMLPEVSQ